MTDGIQVSIRPATLGAQVSPPKIVPSPTIQIAVPYYVQSILRITSEISDQTTFSESLDEIPPAFYSHRGFLYGH